MDIIAVVSITVITSILKNYIKPKFGSLGVHVFIFSLGLIWVAIMNLMNFSPMFNDLVQGGLAFLVTSIGIYEVLLKKVGIDKLSLGGVK